jgi:arylsulfatase A-like enzyme
MPADEHELSRRAYYASLRFVDEQLGLVLASLNATGALESTFILFLSDHGDAQGDHFLWRKGYPYEISAHVPMAARWPEGWPASVPRGTVVEAVVEVRDIAPTMLHVAGLQAQARTMNGTSLACLLQSPSGSGMGCGAQNGPWRSWIDLEHDVVYNISIHWSGATDGQTKYVFWALTGQEQLFNLTEDRYEMTDVSKQTAYGSVMDLWRSRLVQQYTAEGRGELWVRNGSLVPRPKSQLYSPNYPAQTATPSTW